MFGKDAQGEAELSTISQCISLFKICCALDIVGMSLLGKLETSTRVSGQHDIQYLS